jgi:hypothetical protein
MNAPADGAHGKATELRKGADTLRELVPAFRHTPISEFVPVAVAKLLEAVADSVDRGDPVRDQICESALEIARHLHGHLPDDAAGRAR